MAQAVLNEVAIENYTRYWSLPRHHVSLTMVQGSNAGVTGWADWTPGDADVYGDPGHFPQTKSRREIEEHWRLKKASKVDRPVWTTADYYMTDAGQLELGELIKMRDDPKSRMTSSVNILEYASQDVSSMEIDNNGWVCIGLTADSGACDSCHASDGTLREDEDLSIDAIRSGVAV